MKLKGNDEKCKNIHAAKKNSGIFYRKFLMFYHAFANPCAPSIALLFVI